MSRDECTRLAEEIARNPAVAPDRIRRLLEALNAAEQEGGDLPPGYLYAGLHQLVARFDRLQPEPLPGVANPNAPELWQTARAPIPLRMPFDAWVIGVYGYAAPIMSEAAFASESGLVASAEDGRDLFAVNWKIDGADSYATDGEDEIIPPASVTVGTRRKPRRMALFLQAGRRINVRARSLYNVFFDGVVGVTIPDVFAEVGFQLLKSTIP